MLYRLTRSLINLSLNAYFKNINIIGEHNLYPKGATIYIANHPSALIDPLIISIIAKTRLHFLTGAEYFGNKFTSWVLRDQFNMIPVYRPKNYEGQQVDNKDAFAACFKCLENGGSFLIFPEGKSVTAFRLHEVKTGVVRIVLEYKELFPDKHVHICPIGLNYHDAHQFRSSLTVKVGEPFVLEELSAPLDLNDKTAVIELTNQMANRLKDQMIHIDNPDLDDMVEKVTRIYRHELNEQFEAHDLESKFLLRQKIVGVIEHYQNTNPDLVTRINEKVKAYFEKIKDQQINEGYFENQTKQVSTFDYLMIFLLAPFFAAGLLLNGLPYLISKNYFRKKFIPRLDPKTDDRPINPAFSATLSFAVGTSVFLIWFLVLGVVSGIMTTWWIGITVFFGLYLLGRISLRFLFYVYRVRFHRRQKRVFRKNPGLIAELSSLKSEILTELNKYREAFEQMNASTPAP